MTPAQAFGRTLLVALAGAVLAALTLTDSAPGPQLLPVDPTASSLPTAPVASPVPEPTPAATVTLDVLTVRWTR